MHRGEIWLLNLDPTVGTEISKTHPCVIVNDDAIGILPLKVIVPITDWKNSFANAKVTGDVQSPNGKQTTIPLTYDTNGKHYAAKLNTDVSGQYQVKINADIAGEKVNGRFNFNR